MSEERQPPSAEEKIRLTIAKYCHLTDTGDYEGWVRLFAPDGCFRMLGQEHHGPEALRAFIEDDQPPERRGLHLTTDSVIRFVGKEAHVRSNFVFLAAGRNASMIVAAGRYLDILVKCGDEWLFREREAVLVGPVASGPWGSAAGG